MCGSVDIEHKMTIYNTFFDKEEFKDNKDQKMARGVFDAMNKFKPKQLEMYNILNRQLKEGVISKEEHERLSVEHGVKIDIDGLHWD